MAAAPTEDASVDAESKFFSSKKLQFAFVIHFNHLSMRRSWFVNLERFVCLSAIRYVGLILSADLLSVSGNIAR